MDDPKPAGRATSPRWAIGVVTLLAVAALGGIVAWLGHGAPKPSAGQVPSASPSVSPPVCGPVPPGQVSPTTFPTAPEPVAATRQRWRATVRTTCGDIVVVLDGSAAPRAVASFLELARSGYWDDSACDRVTTRTSPISVLQCGNPTGRRPAFPGYEITAENVPADGRLVAGTVALVTPGWDPERQGELLIVHRDFTIPRETMDPPAVIGHVAQGMSVVQRIVSGGGEDRLPDWSPFINVSVLSVAVVPLGSP